MACGHSLGEFAAYEPAQSRGVKPRIPFQRLSQGVSSSSNPTCGEPGGGKLQKPLRRGCLESLPLGYLIVECPAESHNLRIYIHVLQIQRSLQRNAAECLAAAEGDIRLSAGKSPAGTDIKTHAVECQSLTFMDSDCPCRTQWELGECSLYPHRDMIGGIIELIAHVFPRLRLDRMYVAIGQTHLHTMAVCLLHSAYGSVHPSPFGVVAQEHNLRAFLQRKA